MIWTFHKDPFVFVRLLPITITETRSVPASTAGCLAAPNRLDVTVEYNAALFTLHVFVPRKMHRTFVNITERGDFKLEGTGHNLRLTRRCSAAASLEREHLVAYEVQPYSLRRRLVKEEGGDGFLHVGS